MQPLNTAKSPVGDEQDVALVRGFLLLIPVVVPVVGPGTKSRQLPKRSFVLTLSIRVGANAMRSVTALRGFSRSVAKMSRLFL